MTGQPIGVPTGNDLSADPGAKCGNADPATDSGRRLALLIGIADYASNDITDLHGCVNDVQAMQKLLVGKYEFADTDIRCLTNQDATRGNILKAIQEHLIGKSRAYKEASGKKPIVVFHYSGHGSQVLDTSTPRDEVDGLDETIVPYDGMKPEDDITDDQLDQLFKQIAEITDNVTYIFDSCHSGTVTKGLGQPRIVERTFPKIEGAQVETRENGNVAYALITGCKSAERSYEYTERSSGETYGTLTYFLTRALGVANKEEVTYQDIMDGVQRSVRNERPQTPQLSGAKLSNFVFGETSSVAQPFVKVRPMGDKVLVEAGKVHGLTEHSKLAVYAPGIKRFAAPNEPIAQIEVTTVKGHESTAKQISGNAIPEDARAVIVEYAMQASPFPVFLDYHKESHDDAVADAATLDKIRDALEKDSSTKGNFRIVERIVDAHLTIGVRADGTIIITGGRIQSPPIRKQDADAVTRVLAQLRHWAKWYGLRNLDNSSAGIDVEFRIEGTPRKIDSSGVRVFAPDDEIRFVVENKSGKRVFFAILDLQSDGKIEQLYPDRGVVEPLTDGGKWSESTTVFVAEGQTTAFDYIKLLVFDEAVDTFFLTSDAAPKSTKATFQPAAWAVQKGTKEIRVVKPQAWTARLLELSVEKP